MRHQFRLGRGARWLPALGVTMALAAVPAAASAQTTYGPASGGWDPQYTNTPYLAWNGETVKLEKCIPNEYGLTSADLKADGVQANFQTEAWTGTDTDQYTDPQFAPQTVKVFISNDFDTNTYPGEGGVCASGDVVANAPGLARIELNVVANSPGASGKSGAGPTYLALSHEFLAAWMTLSTPSLSQLGSADVNAGDQASYLDVKVQGSFPLGGDQTIMDAVGQSSVTLPNDWVTLADALAVDYTPNNGTISGRSASVDWDTSGESGNVGGHSILNSGICSADTLTATAPPFTGSDGGAYVPSEYLDEGDNCTGGGPDGPFSIAAQGLSSDQTIGPFDQTDAADTDLPDGDLNSQDAPMPAALIDLNIAQNSGSSSDISGVGSFAQADKQVVDSRDGAGDSAPGNLYAPFYDAYIPATARPTDDASGVDGGAGNDFTGFLSIPGDGSYSQYDPGELVGGSPDGLYHFWNTADLESNGGGSTGCFNEGPNPGGGVGSYRQLPQGADEVDVYTDQNGEAQVKYIPGTGAYYDNVGAAKGSDGGCDLQGIGVIGTSSITAKAEYSYKPSNYPEPTSAPVTYNVHSQFNKYLSYVPKGTDSADQNARIVISHAQDVDGTPYANETVCFSNSVTGSGASLAMTQFTGSVDNVHYGNATQVASQGQGEYCLQTDANGNAAIVVFDSNPDMDDVVADYTNEGLLRDLEVDFSKQGSSSAPILPPQGPSSTDGGTAPSGGSTTIVVTPPPAGSPGTTAPATTTTTTSTPHRRAVLARVQILRLFTPARGRHYMVIRIHSGMKTARVRMTLKVGHRTVRRTITVPTNRTVKLHVARSVTRIKGARLVG